VFQATSTSKLVLRQSKKQCLTESSPRVHISATASDDVVSKGRRRGGRQVVEEERKNRVASEKKGR